MAKKRQRKYRLAILEDTTLREVFHIHVNTMSVITMVTVFFVVIMVALSLLIVYTPIRNILPGYSESVRQQLMDESARVDSLQSDLDTQRQYLEVLRQVTAGEIRVDSAHNLDSLQLIERAQIQEFNSEVTDAFMAQYEQKERQQLSLFDTNSPRVLRQLVRPVHGSIIHMPSSATQAYGTVIRVPKRENILSSCRGTVVSAEQGENFTYTVVLQDGSFMAIYRNVSKLLTKQGANLDRGDVIGWMESEQTLVIEFWDAGKYINPEEVIVW